MISSVKQNKTKNRKNRGGAKNAAVGAHAMNVYLSGAGDKLFKVLHYNIIIYYNMYVQFFFHLHYLNETEYDYTFVTD